MKKVRGKYSEDSILLAEFVQLKGIKNAVELGSGPGITLKILSPRYPQTRITGIEIDRESVEYSREFIFGDKKEKSGNIRLIHFDARRVKEILEPQSFGAVFANLPYYREGAGRKSPDSRRRQSRSDITFNLTDFCKITNYLLDNRGGFFTIFTASRFFEYLKTLEKHKLKVDRIRFIYSRGKARVFLAKGSKGKFNTFTITNS